MLITAPYFTLERFDERLQCFRDGKGAFATEVAARASAKLGGRYRVSKVEDGGRVAGEPFNVDGPTFAGVFIRKPQKLRPAAWRGR